MAIPLSALDVRIGLECECMDPDDHGTLLMSLRETTGRILLTGRDFSAQCRHNDLQHVEHQITGYFDNVAAG